jgi:hypothetical protein
MCFTLDHVTDMSLATAVVGTALAGFMQAIVPEPDARVVRRVRRLQPESATKDAMPR